jgi:hypothetical protein
MCGSTPSSDEPWSPSKQFKPIQSNSSQFKAIQANSKHFKGIQSKNIVAHYSMLHPSISIMNTTDFKEKPASGRSQL